MVKFRGKSDPNDTQELNQPDQQNLRGARMSAIFIYSQRSGLESWRRVSAVKTETSSLLVSPRLTNQLPVPSRKHLKKTFTDSIDQPEGDIDQHEDNVGQNNDMRS